MTGHTTADGSSLILMVSTQKQLTEQGQSESSIFKLMRGFLTSGAGALTSLHGTRSGNLRRSARPPWRWRPPATAHAPSLPAWWLGSGGPSSNLRRTFPAAPSNALQGLKTSGQRYRELFSCHFISSAFAICWCYQHNTDGSEACTSNIDRQTETNSLQVLLHSGIMEQ